MFRFTRPARFIASCIAALAVPLAAAQSVQIEFPADHRYADAGDSSSDVQRAEQALQGHFDNLARRHLPPGAKLSVTLRDIDLAGEMRPSRAGPRDLRVLRGRADAPSLSFAYRLEPPGASAGQGEVRLTDPGYLHGATRANPGTTLAHERRLLERWFTATFGPPR